MDLDIATATAAELTQAVRDRQVSSRELLDGLFARAERLNPALNAIVAWDIDRARAATVAADEATARGELTGPLHGLPMTVKDTFETEGLVTTSGAPELARYVPRDDASRSPGSRQQARSSSASPIPGTGVSASVSTYRSFLARPGEKDQMNNGSFDSNAVGTPAVAAIGLNAADGIDVSSLGDGGVAVFAIANGPCAVYAEGLNGGPGVFGYSDTGTGVAAAAMQGVGSQAFGGGTLDFGEIPPPQLPPMPPPAFPQAGIAAVGSPGVCGSGTTDAGGVFESDRGAQLRLVPSATPIEDTSLYETGKVGDLYLWSLNGGQGENSPGKGGAYLYETILWLCMVPAQPDGSAPAYWIQLANTSTF